MFDLSNLDENTYGLIADAAKRHDLDLNDYIALLINDAAALEYEKQQIEDARTANA